MSNPKWEEQILVVSRKVLFDDERLAFHGVSPFVDTILDNASEAIEVKRRGHANDPTPAENNMEINPEYKQLIPYVTVMKGDNVFVYKRLSGSGESRLVNSMSLGVGGHMNKLGGSLAEEIDINALRELEEELKFTHNGAEVYLDTSEINVIGLINGEESEVDKVHLGLVIRIEVPEEIEVTVRETDALEGAWMTEEELQENYDKFESWSQFLIRPVFEPRGE
jgi:predicted NUDIX family phosphoesterase